MNAVQNFDFEGNLFRAIDRDGEEWFAAVDICRSLDLKNSRQAVAKLDDDEKGVCSTYTLGGMQQLQVVSEGGMFALILSSRKAFTPGTVQHRFRKWVTGELLPAIRKTGRYAPDDAKTAPEPPPAGPVADHDAPLEARVGAVRAAERLYGRASARCVWRALGLPAVPDPVPVEAADPEACLAHLLGHAVDGRTVADMIADRDEAALLALGVRIDGDGVWIANAHPAMRAIMAPYPRFWRLLAELPGARVKVMKFGALASRATFVTVLQ